MTFKNKTVWIIGASSGIGKALAMDFAKHKVKLVLSSRKVDELDKIKTECLKHTNNCVVIPLDLEKNSDYKHKVDEVIQKYSTIDYLIINGGISQRSFAHETPIDIDRKLMEINYFGNISITKAVLPQMIKQQSGHIMTVSSIVGEFGFPLRSSYSASKHALHGFYETLRFEHQKDNINVTIAIPGRIKTNISINALDKNGKAHGEMDAGQENGISAESCSKQMIKALEKNKKDVLIGGKELIMVKFKKWLPFLFYKIASKIDAK
jgi:short-subunit dehydrogenase